MTSYIFLPVPTEDMRRDAQTWVSGQARKNKTPCTILAHNYQSGKLKGLARLTNRLLRQVSSDDKLYILAHGWYSSSTDAGPSLLGRSAFGKSKYYSPAGLAEVLRAEGLTKQIVDLRLFACGTGVDVPGGAWALRLKNELLSLGYASVRVTGYLGDVRPSYVIRQTSNYDYTEDNHKGIEINGFIYPASQCKYQF